MGEGGWEGSEKCGEVFLVKQCIHVEVRTTIIHCRHFALPRVICLTKLRIYQNGQGRAGQGRVGLGWAGLGLAWPG